MAAEDILAALQGLKYAPIESPYGIAGASLAQSMPQMITPTMSTGKALGLSLGSVLLSGLLGYQARRDAAAANLESAKLGLQLQSAMTPEARLGIIEQAGGGTMGDLQSRLLDVNNILGAQELARKQAVANKVAELEATGQFNLGPVGTELFNRDVKKAMDVASAGRTPKEKKDWFSEIPNEDKTKIVTARAQVDALKQLANRFRSLEQNAIEYNIAKQIPGSEADLAAASANSMVPQMARLMGEVGNLAQPEQQRLIESTIGGRTSGTQSMADRLDQLANLANGIVSQKLGTYKTAAEGGGEAVLQQLQAGTATPGETEAQKKNRELKARLAKLEAAIASKGK